MNPRLQKLIDLHAQMPWKKSNLLAAGLRQTMEALEKIMALNKAEDMRIIASKVVNQINAMPGDPK